ncbi:MAG TPA: hypothetical protein VGR45_02705, partial [Stellaceae bacterium]|nr:hypothetical protein [Stellaceae bacterium]
ASPEPKATRLPHMISQSNLPEVREIQQKQEAVIFVYAANSGAVGGALRGGDTHVVAEMEAVAWRTDIAVTDGQSIHPTSSLQSNFADSGVAVQRAA